MVLKSDIVSCVIIFSEKYEFIVIYKYTFFYSLLNNIDLVDAILSHFDRRMPLQKRQNILWLIRQM